MRPPSRGRRASVLIGQVPTQRFAPILLVVGSYLAPVSPLISVPIPIAVSSTTPTVTFPTAFSRAPSAFLTIAVLIARLHQHKPIVQRVAVIGIAPPVLVFIKPFQKKDAVAAPPRLGAASIAGARQLTIALFLTTHLNPAQAAGLTAALGQCPVLLADIHTSFNLLVRHC